MISVTDLFVDIIRDLVRETTYKLMNTDDKVAQYALAIELEAYHTVARKLDELVNGTKVDGD